jgi:hypothetical protein
VTLSALIAISPSVAAVFASIDAGQSDHANSLRADRHHPDQIFEITRLSRYL